MNLLYNYLKNIIILEFYCFYLKKVKSLIESNNPSVNGTFCSQMFQRIDSFRCIQIELIRNMSPWEN